jgi:hypothetical protein
MITVRRRIERCQPEKQMKTKHFKDAGLLRNVRFSLAEINQPLMCWVPENEIKYQQQNSHDEKR